MNINRIGYDIDIVRVVTEEVGENGADERLHPTVTTRQISISADHVLIVTSAHLDTMTTGTSCDLQYWKNSLKPESSLMSASARRGRSRMGRCSRLADRRTIFEHLLAFFEGMTVLADALEHLLKGFTAAMREFQCAVPSAQRLVSRHIPERYAASKDLQVSRSSLFFTVPEKISHVCTLFRQLRGSNSKGADSPQSFESYVVMVPSLWKGGG